MTMKEKNNTASSKMSPITIISVISTLFLALLPNSGHAFHAPSTSFRTIKPSLPSQSAFHNRRTTTPLRIPTTTTQLTGDTIPDLSVIALVAGQENYGLAVASLGEALWSFLSAPSLSHAKVLIPAGVATLILVAVSGPMITNGTDPSRVALGLELATAVSVLLGGSYVARLVAPYSPSAKEICFLGLLVSVAGFFSFSQNLVVGGFVTLPSLPSVTLPSLPSLPF